MIQASELRIGNWVINYGKHVCIEADDIVDCHHQPECYDPIPLTPEILEKLGFECRSGVSEMDNGRTHSYVWASLKIPGNQFEIKYEYQSPCENKAYHQGHERFSITAGFGEWNSGEVELKYLHQLQNLYRDLSGTELDVPEKL